MALSPMRFITSARRLRNSAKRSFSAICGAGGVSCQSCAIADFTSSLAETVQSEAVSSTKAVSAKSRARRCKLNIIDHLEIGHFQNINLMKSHNNTTCTDQSVNA